jgi:ATP-dependent DNA helicase PIF1
MEVLTNTVFPGISGPNTPSPTTEFLSDWAILAARNDTMTSINNSILGSMPGKETTFLSADSIVNNGEGTLYPAEYLNAIEVSNLPHHELKLKISAPIILLRNLNPSIGMCNGTKMCLLRLGQNMLEAEILPANMQEQSSYPTNSLDTIHIH